MENQQQMSPIDNNANAWFDELETPTPKPPKKSWKRLGIILGSLAVLTLLCVGVVMNFTGQRTSCLTATDYKALTGTALTDSISSTTNFFASDIAFQQGSTDYDNSTDAGARGEPLLQKIALLYKDLDKTSIKIAISGHYFTKDTAELAQKRIDAIRASLISHGVSSDIIQTTAPAYTEPEDAIPQDGTATTLAITSDQACTEEASLNE